jgi:selenocysteine-specific elongation factor
MRGDVVTSPGWLVPTKAVDVKLRLLPSASHNLTHNAIVTFHTGAAEAQAKLRLLDAEKLEPGQTTFAQLVLDHPIAAVKDDMFIIRSTRDTLGGGQIIDSKAKRHPRFHAATIESLKAREKGTAEEAVLAALDQRRHSELKTLLTSCNLPRAEADKAIESLDAQKRIVILGDKSQLLFSAAAWDNLVQDATQAVQSYHNR